MLPRALGEQLAACDLGRAEISGLLGKKYGKNSSALRQTVVMPVTVYRRFLAARFRFTPRIALTDTRSKRDDHVPCTTTAVQLSEGRPPQGARK